MKCANCGQSIVRDYSARVIGSWTHYRVNDACPKAAPPAIPQPVERPYEKTLSDGDGDLG